MFCALGRQVDQGSSAASVDFQARPRSAPQDPLPLPRKTLQVQPTPRQQQSRLHSILSATAGLSLALRASQVSRAPVRAALQLPGPRPGAPGGFLTALPSGAEACHPSAPPPAPSTSSHRSPCGPSFQPPGGLVRSWSDASSVQP